MPVNINTASDAQLLAIPGVNARVLRVLNASGRAPVNIRGIGVTTWTALHDLLSEVGASRAASGALRAW